MKKNSIVVAIDGPAGSGKSTVSKIIADRLGLMYIDTGAMYRALTLKAMKINIDLTDEKKLINIAKKSKIDLRRDNSGSLKVFIDNEDVTEAIRKPEVTNNVKYIAKIPGVRSEMVKKQRILGYKGGVLEGRDIGTVVCPKANFKFYLDADRNERAERRFKELKPKSSDINFDVVLKDLVERDDSDINRTVGPLKKADDAEFIDTTNLNIEEVVNVLLKKIETKRRFRHPIAEFSLFFWFCRFLCILYLKLCFRVKVFCKDKFPKTGPIIIASNHLSNLDPVLVGTACPRRVNFIAKKELFSNFLFGQILKGLRVIPLDRQDDKNALRKAIEVLKKGEVIAIFPEGTRAHGNIQEAKSGLGFLVRKTHATVVPVYVEGSGDTSKNKFFKKITVTFSEPINENSFPVKGEKKEDYSNISNYVLEKIRELGQK